MELLLKCVNFKDIYTTSCQFQAFNIAINTSLFTERRHAQMFCCRQEMSSAAESPYTSLPCTIIQAQMSQDIGKVNHECRDENGSQIGFCKIALKVTCVSMIVKFQQRVYVPCKMKINLFQLDLLLVKFTPKTKINSIGLWWNVAHASLDITKFYKMNIFKRCMWNFKRYLVQNNSKCNIHHMNTQWIVWYTRINQFLQITNKDQSQCRPVYCNPAIYRSWRLCPTLQTWVVSFTLGQFWHSFQYPIAIKLIIHDT